jgi:hypothetical protein
MNVRNRVKRDRLRELARYRVASVWDGYGQPEDYGYDFRDLVSPYSRAAGNVNAAVMVVLQDWASHDVLRREPMNAEIARYGHDPRRPTNKRLKALLKRHLNVALEDTYGTNLFPFIKSGGMSATIPLQDLVRVAKEFAVPQIAIVQPRLVLALGRKTAEALRRAGATVAELPHPAARISREAMDDAWRRMAVEYRAAAA